MLKNLKTIQVAQILGKTPGSIIAGLRNGRMTPPEKDASGDFVWTKEDLELARVAFSTDRRRKNAAKA